MDYKFEMERKRSDKTPRLKIVEELAKVARLNNYIEFSIGEFNRLADISAGTVKNEFGSWLNALNVLRDYLSRKNLKLVTRKSRSQLSPLTEKELFEEMERIWNYLGHRPSRIEWESSNPKISHGVYRYRFNGWANACLKFIEYKMGTSIIITEKQKDTKEVGRISMKRFEESIKIFSGKNIPASVRVRVLSRDNFRCVYCGRSPATDIDIKLHIDHKIPFSKGGKTTIDNLQTLCQECNLGKSNYTL